MSLMPYPEPLKESVGNNQPNLSEDLRKIKRGLSALGIVEEDTSEDFITRALDTGIKVFQKDNGLKIDGILRPGGETERSLFETLTRRPSEELFGPDPMKSTGLGIGFGTGISTLGQLQEAAKKSGGHVFTYVKPREDKPSPSNRIIKNLQGQQHKETEEDTSPVQYDATGRMISPTKNEKEVKETQSSVPKKENKIDFNQKIKDLDFNPDGPGIADNKLAILFDGRLTARSTGEASRKQAIIEFPELRGNQADNKADAFRHALWNVKMTRELGAKKAKEFADAYERSRPNASQGSLIMDLENNKIARELALDPKNKDKSDVEIVREALAEGKLHVTPPKIKGEVTQPQHHIPLQGRRGLTATGRTYNKKR